MCNENIKKGDVVRVGRKSVGDSINMEGLRKRLGRDFSGSVKEVRRDDAEFVLVADSSGGDGREYLFAFCDVVEIIKSNSNSNNNMTDKFGLVALSMGQRLRLSADDKVLIRAGLMDSCSMGATEAGREEMLAILFEDYKEKLVARGKEIVAEAEAEDK